MELGLETHFFYFLFFFFGHIFVCLKNGLFSSLSSFQAEIITLTSVLS